jgi:hypothetical protein
MATVRKIFGFRLRAFKESESTVVIGNARCMQLLGTHLNIKRPETLPPEHSEESVQVLRGQPMNSADNDNSVACVLQGLRPVNTHVTQSQPTQQCT